MVLLIMITSKYNQIFHVIRKKYAHPVCFAELEVLRETNLEIRLDLDITIRTGIVNNLEDLLRSELLYRRKNES